MSFILDALKKSETDRQQQSSAEFTAIPTSPGAPSVPRWLWIVAALLFINLAVLTGLLLRPEVSPEQQQQSVNDESFTERAANGIDGARPDFEEQVAAARRNRPEQQRRAADVAVLTPNQETEIPETASPKVVVAAPSSVPATDIYPTIHEISADGSISLPELHLDIHVYSSKPEERFVFINMSKLREGSQLNEGPVVAEITPDGVVLGHQGRLFLLPRE